MKSPVRIMGYPFGFISLILSTMSFRPFFLAIGPTWSRWVLTKKNLRPDFLSFISAQVAVLMQAASQPMEGFSGVSESQYVPHLRRDTFFVL